MGDQARVISPEEEQEKKEKKPSAVNVHDKAGETNTN